MFLITTVRQEIIGRAVYSLPCKLPQITMNLIKEADQPHRATVMFAYQLPSLKIDIPSTSSAFCSMWVVDDASPQRTLWNPCFMLLFFTGDLWLYKHYGTIHRLVVHIPVLLLIMASVFNESHYIGCSASHNIQFFLIPTFTC